MKRKIISIRLASGLALLGISLGACTTQAWYSGGQEAQRQQCRERYPAAADQQQCIEEVNKNNYDQYQRERGKH